MSHEEPEKSKLERIKHEASLFKGALKHAERITDGYLTDSKLSEEELKKEFNRVLDDLLEEVRKEREILGGL